MDATTTETQALNKEERFALERFGRLLQRRLQVAVACRQIPATDQGQTWLIHALDSAIADELRQLDRLDLGAEGRGLLMTFRQALGWVRSGAEQAA